MTGLSEESLGDIDHTPEVPVHDPLELRERLAQIHASAKAIKRTKAQQRDVSRQEKIRGTAAEPGQLGKRWREANRASAKPLDVMSLFRHQSQLISSIDLYRHIRDFFLLGGYGCVSGDTLLTTPSGSVRIDQFAGGTILTYNEENGALEWAVAGVAIDHESVPMIRIKTVSGHSLDCTWGHKLMTPDGWRLAGELRASWGHASEIRLLVSGAFHPQTNSDTSPSGLHEGERHCSHRPEGSRADYLAYLHSGDGQPLLVTGIDQASSQPQGDALGRSQRCSHRDGCQLLREHNHSCQSSDQKPRTRSSLQLDRPEEALVDRSFWQSSESPSGSCRSLAQSHDYKDPGQKVLESSQVTLDQFSLASEYSLISSIEEIGESVYYDLTVPSNHTYVANGMVSHNSGKSATLVFLILKIVDWYNGKAPTVFGIGSPTITFFRKTIWQDLEKILITTGSKYSYDQQQNKIQIGTVTFVIVPTEHPSDIYGFNFNGFLCDELDELPQDKALEAYGAIRERTRVQLPPITPEEWHYAMRFKELEQTRILWPERFDDCGAPEGEPCKMLPRSDGRNDGRVKDVVPGGKKNGMCMRHEHEEAKEMRGRAPFRVFATTAQGYRGIYQITEELKEKNDGFVLIRGLTKDNTANSKSYYTDLYKIYNENERAAFLEGKFVNLSSGRVYPDYDGSRHEVKREDGKPLFELDSDETVYIGQDLNSGFSKASSFVKRDGKLYCVKGFSFKSISDAPRILRTAFPTQRILWYPDASAKEIMSGYSKEIREMGIELRLSAQNPSVLERIFIINKLFKLDRLFLFAGPDTRDLQMGLKTRQYDDNGKPEKGKGEKATDHACFPAGTLIATDRGNVPIEQLVPGDRAMTRRGFRLIKALYYTGQHLTISIPGVPGLESTVDHPFYDSSEGRFVRASLLTQSNTLCILKQEEIELCKRLEELRKLFLKASRTDAILILSAETTEFTTSLRNTMSDLGRLISTVKSGNRFTERSQKEWLSITSMVTRLTTASRICNSRDRENTIANILVNGSQTIESLIESILAGQSQKLPSGTRAKRALLGIANTMKKWLQAFTRKVSSSAITAALSLKQLFKGRLSTTAQGTALRPQDGQVVWTTRKGLVAGAEKSSSSTSIPRYDAVPKYAEQDSDLKKNVFNITVDDAHEYFANGVLVSNCDSAEYALWRIVASQAEFRDLWNLTRSGKIDEENPEGRVYA